MALDPHSNGIRFVLNGRSVEAGDFSPETTLLDFIRARGLTGAKESCAEGECGSCTVLMVQQSPAGVQYCPVNSCLLFLPMAAGQEIYTVESLASNGALVEAQQAMIERGGSQCGYCTPGFVMSLVAEQYRPDRIGPCDPHAAAGNLCRCTGYRPIRDAALALGPAPAGPLLDRLAQPAPALEPVACEGAGAAFARPSGLAECIELLSAHPDARIIAGGTDLVVESNLRGRRFSRLISVEAIPALRAFRETDDAVEIGAGLTLSEIAALWRTAPAVWHEWLPLFASLQIRNRATLGGNLATASPIGDGPPLLLALDAEVRIAGPAGERTIPLAPFFRGYRQTALAAGELLVAIRIPKPLPRQARFFKVAKRRIDDISTVAACFAIDLDGDGRIERARFAYGGVAATPIRAAEAEDAVLGLRWTESAVRRAQDILARTLAPISDHRGSAAYRLAMAQSLLAKFHYEQQEEAAA